jgi:protein ImuA
MSTAKATLSALRQRMATIEATAGTPGAGPPRIALDRAAVDAALGGGLARAALHEIHAATGADTIAANGFSLALAASASAGRPIVWVRQDHAAREGGGLGGDGLAGLGLDPAALILVRLRDPLAVLRAGGEAARCAALGAVIVEPWGEPRALDLTVQRRFQLAAEASGVTVFLLRPGARPRPGSAETRWQVASGPAVPLSMNAPGHPTFDLTLLRHRHGPPGGPWRLEWNRDEKLFKPPALLRDPAALPRLEPAAPPAERTAFRLAG